jgi:F-type H+-transporting ATPase subunit b
VLINWFTVAAQIVNFLILVALLKRFLYGPIVNAMAAREETIAARMAEARQKQQEAAAEEAALKQQVRDIETRRLEMLSQAEGEAQRHKQGLLAQARQEVAEVKGKWLESLKREQDAFFQNLSQRLLQEVLVISRRALSKMGNVNLEQRLLEVFWESLGELPAAERQAMLDSIKETGGRLSITTAFSLPEDAREKLEARAREHFGPDLSLNFNTSGELLAGIELVTSSRKIAWSLGDYLDNLEEDLSQAFRDLDKSEAA